MKIAHGCTRDADCEAPPYDACHVTGCVGWQNARRIRSEIPNSDLLTPEEHDAVRLTADLWNALTRITGPAGSREGDLNELVAHIHAIQRYIGSQAAARAYPTKYRLLGEVLK